jgi:hypothetical protein
MMKVHREPTKSLDRVSTQAAPANVRREIQGWFAQCRKATFESAILIRCPDRETVVLAYNEQGKQAARVDQEAEGNGRPGVGRRSQEHAGAFPRTPRRRLVARVLADIV